MDKRDAENARKSKPPIAVLAVLLAVLGAGLYAVVADNSCPLAAGPANAGPAALASPIPEENLAIMTAASQTSAKAAREAVEKLVSEQKFEAAATECARIREEARKSRNVPLWTWALIKEGQLRSALHGYETAVRFFKEQPWPDSLVERDMLDLFYAHSLVTYYRAYSWEINSREKVEAKGPIDLKSWTRDQIFDEAWQSLLRVWKDRDRLADHKAVQYPDFWSPGDYPAGVRDSLRDGVVYLLARLLGDTSFWTPRQSNETWLLDLANILASAGKNSAADASAILADPTRHPVERISGPGRPHPSPPAGAAAPPASPPSAPRPASAPSGNDVFAKVLEKLAVDRAPLAALLGQYSSVMVKDNALEVLFGSGRGFFVTSIQEKDIRAVEKAASEVMGRETKVRFAEENEAAGGPIRPGRELESALKDPTVKFFMDKFKAQVLSADPIQSSRDAGPKGRGPTENGT